MLALVVTWHRGMNGACIRHLLDELAFRNCNKVRARGSSRWPHGCRSSVCAARIVLNGIGTRTWSSGPRRLASTRAVS